MWSFHSVGDCETWRLGSHVLESVVWIYIVAPSLTSWAVLGKLLHPRVPQFLTHQWRHQQSPFCSLWRIYELIYGKGIWNVISTQLSFYHITNSLVASSIISIIISIIPGTACQTQLKAVLKLNQAELQVKWRRNSFIALPGKGDHSRLMPSKGRG